MRHRGRRTAAGGGSSPTTEQPLSELSLEYSYEELYEATGGFCSARKIGHGAYGHVYRGTLRDGNEVAVKYLYGSMQAAGFEDEVKVLSKIRHQNLVILMGFSRHENRGLLVYELLAGGDVGSRLAKGPPLGWRQRLNIALDAACGLSHLHNSNPKVYHRDIKAGNILLDRNGTAKWGDFGLAFFSAARSQKVLRAAGTVGYADPKYISTAVVTEKSEVYSFGWVLIELLTAKAPAVQHSNGSVFYFATRLQDCATGRLSLQRLLLFVDPRPGWPNSVATALGKLSLRCVAPQEHERPDFRALVLELRKLLEQSEGLAPAAEGTGKAARRTPVDSDAAGPPARGASGAPAASALPNLRLLWSPAGGGNNSPMTPRRSPLTSRRSPLEASKTTSATNENELAPATSVQRQQRRRPMQSSSLQSPALSMSPPISKGMISACNRSAQATVTPQQQPPTTNCRRICASTLAAKATLNGGGSDDTSYGESTRGSDDAAAVAAELDAIRENQYAVRSHLEPSTSLPTVVKRMGPLEPTVAYSPQSPRKESSAPSFTATTPAWMATGQTTSVSAQANENGRPPPRPPPSVAPTPDQHFHMVNTQQQQEEQTTQHSSRDYRPQQQHHAAKPEPPTLASSTPHSPCSPSTPAAMLTRAPAVRHVTTSWRQQQQRHLSMPNSWMGPVVLTATPSACKGESFLRPTIGLPCHSSTRSLSLTRLPDLGLQQTVLPVQAASAVAATTQVASPPAAHQVPPVAYWRNSFAFGVLESATSEPVLLPVPQTARAPATAASQQQKLWQRQALTTTTPSSHLVESTMTPNENAAEHYRRRATGAQAPVFGEGQPPSNSSMEQRPMRQLTSSAFTTSQRALLQRETTKRESGNDDVVGGGGGMLDQAVHILNCRRLPDEAPRPTGVTASPSRNGSYGTAAAIAEAPVSNTPPRRISAAISASPPPSPPDRSVSSATSRRDGRQEDQPRVSVVSKRHIRSHASSQLYKASSTPHRGEDLSKHDSSKRDKEYRNAYSQPTRLQVVTDPLEVRLAQIKARILGTLEDTSEASTKGTLNPLMGGTSSGMYECCDSALLSNAALAMSNGSLDLHAAAELSSFLIH